MAYTVKQLANLSGISVRTLHWYDESDLLKPAYYGDNGYRYYEEEQLLLLQQILFLKELGFNLNQVRELLTQNQFDKIRSLKAQKNTLENNITRMEKLIKTIDKTILHLQGKGTMKDKEFYDGMDKPQQEQYEQYIVQYHGMAAEDLVVQSIKRTVEPDSTQWHKIKDEGNKIYSKLAEHLEAGHDERSEKIQALIQQHFAMTQRLMDTSKDVYLALAQLYSEHPDFKKFFDVHHPRLVGFIVKAMQYYTNENLS